MSIGAAMRVLFSGTAPPQMSTLSLHDALPISNGRVAILVNLANLTRGQANLCIPFVSRHQRGCASCGANHLRAATRNRSEEHTSELQSHSDLVCRLLLEKKTPTRRADLATTLA